MEAEIFFGRRVTYRKKHSSGSLGKIRKKKKKKKVKIRAQISEQKYRRDTEEGCPMYTRKNASD